MKLDSDDFELFGLARRFELDRASLDRHWRELQATAHPDRFATESAAGRRVAMQWAVRINQAYQRMKDPLQRAAYLCELLGAPIEADNNTAMPVDFLMQQMQWREALDDAGTSAPQVDALAQHVTARHAAALSELASMLDDRKDFAAAAQQVRALMFIERFAQDIDQRLEALGK